MRKGLKLTSFVAYGLLMLWLLFGQRMGQGSEGLVQLQPLRTVKQFLWVIVNSDQPGLRTHAWINLLGNVAMFVPLGFLIPWIWKYWQRFWRHFLLMAGIIVAVELSQFCFHLGTCDVDDLLLNLAGTLLGYGVYRLWMLILPWGKTSADPA